MCGDQELWLLAGYRLLSVDETSAYVVERIWSWRVLSTGKADVLECEDSVLG